MQIERDRARQAANARQMSDRDILRMVCHETGAAYRQVHLPPSASAPLDAATVRRWPTEAYAGRPYQLRPLEGAA